MTCLRARSMTCSMVPRLVGRGHMQFRTLSHWEFSVVQAGVALKGSSALVAQGMSGWPDLDIIYISIYLYTIYLYIYIYIEISEFRYTVRFGSEHGYNLTFAPLSTSQPLPRRKLCSHLLGVSRATDCEVPAGHQHRQMREPGGLRGAGSEDVGLCLKPSVAPAFCIRVTSH